MYVKEGTAVSHNLEGYWNDMGTFDSILDTANFVRDNNFNLSYELEAWAKS
jgi:dTDP-glucose pyrophosphorylase